MHLVVINDNVEIALLLEKHPKYIRNIKNKSGESPMDLCRGKKGKIFYQMIASQNQSNHGNFNNNIKSNNFGVPQLNNDFNNFNNNQNIMNMQNLNNNNNFGMNSNKRKRTKKINLEIITTCQEITI